MLVFWDWGMSPASRQRLRIARMYLGPTVGFERVVVVVGVRSVVSGGGRLTVGLGRMESAGWSGSRAHVGSLAARWARRKRAAWRLFGGVGVACTHS